LEQNIFLLWILSMGSLIFLMQAGFFLLEGGQVRSRDVSNVLMKMTGHMGLGIVVFLLIGFAIKQYAWPLASLPGGRYLPWSFTSDGPQSLSFFMSLMFALVSCAIPSGCFSGRMKFSTYLIFAVVYVGIIYPVFAYILWNGPLARLGVQDYAGSLGVHAIGGIMGLVGAKFLGARKLRSEPHDVPMMGFGALLLMFCWFGFNLGSVPGYANMAADLPVVAVNTLAAIAGGILGSLFVSNWLQGKSNPVVTPNGGLAGAVAICSGVHLFHPLMAIALGLVAGAQIPFTSKFLYEKLGIDDPCDVGPVHAIPGVLGGALCGLAFIGMPHGFHGYTVALGAQLLATAAAIVYGVLSAGALFWILKHTIGLRVSEESETSGLDFSQHGMAAYPELTAAMAGAFANSAVANPLHVLSGVRVREVMADVPAVLVTDLLSTAQELMAEHQMFSLPVMDHDGFLCGVVSISDVTKIAMDERYNVRVAAVYTRDAKFAFPDETVHEVVERMAKQRLANLPVVSRRNPRELLGMMSKSEVVRAYRHAVAGAAVN
jgi:ammonium transporter, Amt family